MRFIGQCVYTRGIYPSIVEVEQRTYGDREVDDLIAPSHLMQGGDIRGCNVRRVAIHLVDKTEERLLRPLTGASSRPAGEAARQPTRL